MDNPKPTPEDLPAIPDYYIIPGIIKSDGEPLTVMDITDALEASFNVGCAVKYLCRAGRKPGNPRVGDLTKALHCVARARRVETSRAQS